MQIRKEVTQAWKVLSLQTYAVPMKHRNMAHLLPGSVQTKAELSASLAGGPGRHGGGGAGLAVRRPAWLWHSHVDGRSGAAMAQPANHAAMPAAGAEDLAATLRSITSELRELHLLVLENRREALQAEMPRLEQDAAAVQERQNRLRAEQSAQTQEMIDLESQMSRPGLTAEQRDELEARRSVLYRSPARLAALEAELARNEARVRERMALLDQRLRQLAHRAEQLASTAR